MGYRLWKKTKKILISSLGVLQIKKREKRLRSGGEAIEKRLENTMKNRKYEIKKLGK